MFDYLSAKENGISRCFRDLLDPKGKHGQRRLFLDSFLRRIGADQLAGPAACQKVSVEQPTDTNRRIDIYLEFENGLIGIENKPWARDGDFQLHDYAAWLMKTARHRQFKYWRLIYISNTEPDPSSICNAEREQLKRDGRFYQMPYSEVIEWLGEGAANSKALAVRIFIEQLAKFLLTNVNGELDMCEELQVRDGVLASPGNLEAAFLVNAAFESIKRHLLDLLKKDLQTKLIENGHRIESDEGFYKGKAADYRGLQSNEIRIIFDNQQDAMLTIGFEESGYRYFYFGIAGRNVNLVKSAIPRAEITRKMTILFGASAPVGINDHWIWFRYPDGIDVLGFRFDEEFRHWSNHPKPWIAMRDGTLADKILQIADMVRDAFRGHMHLLMPDD
ncbi:PD-(D/E)XK nuclease family protein [uncultured Thiodictyon sp.]|uniref:PDDEXK-like family protein n=1 Tax=uncultured Thiodictyon sp. TaxID=1846217 RepID=UPI0025DD2128|nr:PD-(D/E)XK nuclease family protein [uncultured Thiodictyon sp.]